MNRFRLTNATIVDGTGRDPFTGDLTVEGSKITEGAAAVVIDCAGFAIAPGFIDAHSHSDLQSVEGRREKLLQGVTSEVVGNCGFSAFPCREEALAIREFANGIFRGGDDWGWRSARDYLDALGPAATSVSSLVGHGTLRIACSGDVDRMEGVLDEALGEGACGFSTGLMYAPGSFAPKAELLRLCAVTARKGRIYATHIRDYSGGLVEAVDEQIDLARRSGCRLQISHFQAVGQRFWPQQQIALDHIERARAESIDIAFDCYPYVAGSTVLTQLLPQWTLEGGIGALLDRLSGPLRDRIIDETDRGLAQTWADIYIAAVAHDGAGLVGRNLVQIADERGCPPAQAAVDLLIEQDGAVNILEFNQSEANLRQTLTHPLSMVISDGFYVKGRPHPRLHGTFPTLLGEYVRTRGWLSLAEAVRKITSAPAERFGMRDRGRLAPGYKADLVIFDPGRIGSPATYSDPEQRPEGVTAVFRAGKIAWLSDSSDGRRFQALRDAARPKLTQ